MKPSPKLKKNGGPGWRPAGLPTTQAGRSATLSGQIVVQIRDALFSGELSPGEAIGSESSLAEQFDVSRMSIRDALRSLEAMGIVEIRMGAGGGARIAQGSQERFADALAVQLSLTGVSDGEVLQAQAAIESTAAELAAVNATPDDLAELDRLLHDAAAALDDPARSTELGMAFHLSVARASHNRVLLMQLQAIRNVIWSEHHPRTHRERAERVLTAHREIYQAIRDRRGEEAGRLMRRHLAYVEKSKTDPEGIAENIPDQPPAC